MKLAISATGISLDAMVDPRFGRCQHFLIVDTDTMTLDVLDNGAIALGGGAGIQAAQAMADKGVTHVLTGNCGPNAHSALGAAGIAVMANCTGRVRDVVAQFKAGVLAPARQPSVTDHYGVSETLPSSLAGTAPIGPGGGMGRGMGMGRGGGRGAGCSRRMAAAGGQAGRPVTGPSQTDAEALKRQSAELEAKLQQIRQDLDKLTGQRTG